MRYARCMAFYHGNERTVLTDTDVDLFDVDREVEQRLRDRHPHIYATGFSHDPPDFYTANNYPEEHRDVIWGLSNEPGFVARLPLISGALDGWERLLAADYQP